jgi:alkanesulfonate monooxygenase SsuD/methylene tetrahydromethanopterin reductase-like flavin-dependent oxidoreductase (luciferase family)
MRLSLGLDPGRPWPHVRALAQQADAAGWHAVYICDDFMPHDRAGRAADGPMLECWSTLAALATQTAGIRLGSLVLGNTYRHPAVVANMAATLDQVSRGRVVLGIGAGWQPNEHSAYGIALPAERGRVAALGEACAVIRALPGQRRVPLLVGGGGQRTLRVAARHGDVWHAWADPAVLARKNAALDRYCRDLGREPGDIARATGATVTVRPGPPSDWAAGDHVQGTTAEVLSRLLAFRDAVLPGLSR